MSREVQDRARGIVGFDLLPDDKPCEREIIERIAAALAEQDAEIAALTIERDKIEDRLSVAVDNLRAQRDALEIAHNRATGALVDAATVPIDDLERGIRLLAVQRDALVKTLAPILVLIHAHPRKATIVASVVDAADAALAAGKGER